MFHKVSVVTLIIVVALGFSSVTSIRGAEKIDPQPFTEGNTTTSSTTTSTTPATTTSSTETPKSTTAKPNTTTASPNTTTVAPSTTSSSTTSVKPTPAPPTPTPTPAPTPTVHPTPAPAPKPPRKFDGPSFIGGFILSLALVAIGFVSYKFYKSRTQSNNYHTL